MIDMRNHRLAVLPLFKHGIDRLLHDIDRVLPGTDRMSSRGLVTLMCTGPPISGVVAVSAASNPMKFPRRDHGNGGFSNIDIPPAVSVEPLSSIDLAAPTHRRQSGRDISASLTAATLDDFSATTAGAFNSNQRVPSYHVVIREREKW
jgi:hypothetical protein